MREWQKNLLALGIVAAVVLIGLFFAARPAVLLGVDADALAQSLAGQVEMADGACTPQGNGVWSCAERGSSGGISWYAVQVHHLGCWRARKLRPDGTMSGQTMSGCITIWNELAPNDRVASDD
jgi:hypothetical protein